ncbi:alpha/beta hydrolase family protein [Plantactinospora sp. GCM10030261]|uniref:alpha/beta hydrolase family protein n=1 Tax=Plantactinospora sp. GCM10030261 TaxID=3273420 RepID=UPI00360F164A
MAVDPRTVLDRPAPPPDQTIAYGDHPDQVVDLRWPAAPTERPYPLVVVIHGGFWRSEYDRRHTGPLATALAELGYPVAQLEYRRTGQPGGGWPATGDDVVAGLTALPGLLADRADIVAAGPPILLGHSAGGQLALWSAGAGVPVAGVLALAPVADLVEAHRRDLDDGAVTALLGGGPDEVPERYAAADPALTVPPPAPVVVVHGTADRQVPVEISRHYVAAATTAGGDVTLVELPGCEHFGLIDPLSEAWPRVTAALRAIHRP